MKKTSWLFVAAILFTQVLYSQITSVKAYVITIKDDTLRGEIKINPKKELEVYEKITLIISPTEKKTFKPDKVKEYVTDSARFVSRMLDEQMTFLKVLSSGKINLYEYQYYWEKPNKDVVVKSEYYMEQIGDKKATKIKQGNKYKKQLAGVMADNPDLVKSFDEQDFDPAEMIEIFNQYNTEAN